MKTAFMDNEFNTLVAQQTSIADSKNNQKVYEAVKRSMDVLGALIAFVLFTPLCLGVALFIKLTSPGPVFFKQTRLGYRGRPFEIYKFRTMHVDAEKDSGPVWSKKGDNRMIIGGAFLRKSKIDEIPQFINVLKGEMSIIGPRPERPFFVARLKNEVPRYEQRLLIKPGITGLAQVLHRADETIKDVRIKVRYDLFYIRKMCLLVDLRILLKTLSVVLFGVRPRLKGTWR